MSHLEDLLSDKAIGKVMGRCMGLDRPLTPAEVQAYAKASRALERTREIDEAITLLENLGYRVIEPLPNGEQQ